MGNRTHTTPPLPPPDPTLTMAYWDKRLQACTALPDTLQAQELLSPDRIDSIKQHDLSHLVDSFNKYEIDKAGVIDSWQRDAFQNAIENFRLSILKNSRDDLADKQKNDYVQEKSVLGVVGETFLSVVRDSGLALVGSALVPVLAAGAPITLGGLAAAALITGVLGAATYSIPELFSPEGNFSKVEEEVALGFVTGLVCGFSGGGAVKVFEKMFRQAKVFIPLMIDGVVGAGAPAAVRTRMAGEGWEEAARSFAINGAIGAATLGMGSALFKSVGRSFRFGLEHATPVYQGLVPVVPLERNLTYFVNEKDCYAVLKKWDQAGEKKVTDYLWLAEKLADERKYAEAAGLYDELLVRLGTDHPLNQKLTARFYEMSRASRTIRANIPEESVKKIEELFYFFSRKKINTFSELRGESLAFSTGIENGIEFSTYNNGVALQGYLIRHPATEIITPVFHQISQHGDKSGAGMWLARKFAQFFRDELGSTQVVVSAICDQGYCYWPRIGIKTLDRGMAEGLGFSSRQVASITPPQNISALYRKVIACALRERPNLAPSSTENVSELIESILASQATPAELASRYPRILREAVQWNAEENLFNRFNQSDIGYYGIISIDKITKRSFL